MKALYGNVGKKLMILAQVMGVLFLVGGVIAFLAVASLDFIEIALTVLGGCVMAFFSTWSLYGFGKLVDDVGALRQQKEVPAQEVVPDELPNPTEKA